ncbi:uncharacterized protein LOC126670457 [Mercurialis annua]|uniref:uncharacterized protein LOC126670456 n=1 Tax=Mercurialis annua TaxID=3986 RepID=UPI00215FB8FF|nr:uncharacterized protein LOC126670456 [Mercurialis annua]XP_050220150.1 uncharacterized protein LOC126670457 [Mercurialis annua]
MNDKSRNKGLMDFFKIEPKNLDSSMSSSSEAIINIPQKRSRVEFNPDELVVDPGVRNYIESYDVSIRDHVRMAYLSKGPCQPYRFDFPKKKQGKNMRSFQAVWFRKFPWLEYSDEKDSAYCLYCYLFARPSSRSTAFTSKGFNNWKKAIESFNEHVGGVSSIHNSARCDCEDFQNQHQNMSLALIAQNPEMEVTYHTRLTVVLHVVRILLLQGLAFCSDESSISSNKGNFLEMMTWYADCNESVRNIIDSNAHDYNQVTSPQIQKELVKACASQITSIMLTELGDRNFSILIDEVWDEFMKQQMVVFLRFVDKNGEVIERFLAIETIGDTSFGSLKAVFARHGLSISKLRGQSYGGVSNMRGEFNDLKELIRNENPFAFCIHHFAHQLHSVVVSVAKNIPAVWDLFTYTSMIVDTVGDFSKRTNASEQKYHDILKKLEADDSLIGRDKYQETSFARPSDTRWGSYYVTLIRLMCMWDSVLWVLEKVHEDGFLFGHRESAGSLIEKMESFQFVFVLHFMRKILGTSHVLSNSLLHRNIATAMNLIDYFKEVLQKLREDGWDALLQEVVIFCQKMHIPVPDMEEHLPIPGRSRRVGQTITYHHHYRNEIFLAVIDLLVVEMNNRFSETSNVLLGYISCLDPSNSFARFDQHKLISFAMLYSDDFSSTDMSILKDQLQTYICDVRKSSDFTSCHDLASLARKMVQTYRHLVFPLVYRLIELALILPVATSSVERAVSSMNIIKTELHDMTRDEWINDRMVCYIESGIFAAIDDEDILQHF